MIDIVQAFDYDIKTLLLKSKYLECLNEVASFQLAGDSKIAEIADNGKKRNDGKSVSIKELQARPMRTPRVLNL